MWKYFLRRNRKSTHRIRVQRCSKWFHLARARSDQWWHSWGRFPWCLPGTGLGSTQDLPEPCLKRLNNCSKSKNIYFDAVLWHNKIYNLFLPMGVAHPKEAAKERTTRAARRNIFKRKTKRRRIISLAFYRIQTHTKVMAIALSVRWVWSRIPCKTF